MLLSLTKSWGRYIISQNEGLYDVASENFGDEEYGIGFRLEATDLRDKFNEILADMIDDDAQQLKFLKLGLMRMYF